MGVEGDICVIDNYTIIHTNGENKELVYSLWEEMGIVMIMQTHAGHYYVLSRVSTSGSFDYHYRSYRRQSQRLDWSRLQPVDTETLAESTRVPVLLLVGLLGFGLEITLYGRRSESYE